MKGGGDTRRRCSFHGHDSFRSNFLIDSLVPGSSQEVQLAGWLSAGESIGISALAWGEAAQLFNATGRRSRSFADCCIAAMALRTGASLATSNSADFQAFGPYGLILA